MTPRCSSDPFPPARVRLPRALPRATGLCLTALSVLGALTLAPPSLARVLRIEIERRVEIQPEQPFRLAPPASASPESGSALAGRAGDTVAYELIEGQVHFGFDPKNPANHLVADLALAETGAEGLVHARADFSVLQPIDPAQRSGTGLVDVPNRGRRLILGGMNRVQKPFGAAATFDPTNSADWGDGFLMSQGLTVIWVGWQADAPSFPGAHRLRVPHARTQQGHPVTSVARSDWVVDVASARLELATLGHVAHRAAAQKAPLAAHADPTGKVDEHAPRDRLTRRRTREGKRELVPRSRWRFDEAREAILPRSDDASEPAPFEAGWIYELVYVAEAPPVAGLGLAAFRDFARYAESDPTCPFPVSRTVAHGLSQSGRFLRHFLYEGFNHDESNQAVFEGFMIQIAGSGRGGFNHRFGHPGRVGNPFANFFYPGDDFPFTSRATESQGRREGLLDRAAARGPLPKIFQINTGYEYWGRAASLIHMTSDGTKDVPPLPNERLYHLDSAPHYALPFPPNPKSEVQPGLFLGSSVDTSPHQRALLLHLLRWVEQDQTPPPSVIPSLAAKTLTEADLLRFPIAALKKPRSPHVAYPADYGPRRNQGIVDQQPPSLGPPFAIRVPAIDALGNERTGIRPLEVRVPIGTYTPWARRYAAPFARDEMTGYIGSFWPLAATDDDKKAGDSRPSLATFYPSREAYDAQVAAEVEALVRAGFVLEIDRERLRQAAAERWVWAQSRPEMLSSRAADSPN